MKLTAKQLKRMIKEELEKVLTEVGRDEWGWNKAADNDFQFDTDLYKDDRSSRVMVFSQNTDDYKENREYTHGAMSHALKHFAEWNLERVMSDVEGIFKMIKKELGDSPFWLIDKTNPQVVQRGNLSDLKVGDVGNTIDMVNDKFLEGKDLLPIEQAIYDKAKGLTDAYNDVVVKISEEAFDLSDENVQDYKDLQHILKSERYVKFVVYEPKRSAMRRGSPKSSTHLFDLKKGIRAIELSNGNIATIFKIAGDDKDPVEVLSQYIADRKLESIPGKGIFNLRQSAAYVDYVDAPSQAPGGQSRIVDPYGEIPDPDRFHGGTDVKQSKIDKYSMAPSATPEWPAGLQDVPISKWRSADKASHGQYNLGYAPGERTIHHGGPAGGHKTSPPPKGQDPSREYSQLSKWFRTYAPGELAHIHPSGEWKTKDRPEAPRVNK